MSTLWVVGDSTLSSFDDKYYYPRYGYGTKLGCYLNSKVQVNNLALSGRSSLSFTKEENYKELLAGMKAGDFLIIGFGHNDEKTEAKTKDAFYSLQSRCKSYLKQGIKEIKIKQKIRLISKITNQKINQSNAKVLKQQTHD